MHSNIRKHIVTGLCIIATILAGAVDTSASAAGTNTTKSTTQTKTKSKTKTTSSGKTNKSQSSKKSSKKNSSKSSSSKKKGNKSETSEEIKKRQQDTQKEIQLTKEQIAQNDRSVKQHLAELSELDNSISISKGQINELSTQLNSIEGRISALQSEIESNKTELAKLREEYLKAVKKMRLRKGTNSSLAFIFASDNFNQALRRMRYLKQFSQWKDKKSKDISEKVNQLNYQTQLLAQTKQEQNVALNKQLTVNKKLENQYAQQDAIVTELKRNGDALRSHLARKQAEANELKSRIASVIAQEQKRADEQRRAEEQRKAEEKRLADERAAKKAEADRLAEEKRKDAEKETKNLASNTSKKQAEKKEQTKVLKENKKEQTKDNKKEQQKNKDSKEYASARKRNPRSDNSNTAKPAAPTSTASADVAKNNTSLSSFESAKGSLPKPVSGSFRVTSPFGKHPLPDLPDVVYDNPGIDAEVSSGASASAVFAGKVSGVYVIAGYQTVIIVNHGTYYTVYGNIASPSVSVGSVVKQGQTLGKLATDPDNGNRTSIHFEVWKNREKLNPLEWIR